MRAEQYPPGLVKQTLARIVSAVQWMIIGCTVMGDTAVDTFGVSRAAVDKLKENKGAAIMGSWFMGSTISASLIKTGAFEVRLGGELVWSKICIDCSRSAYVSQWPSQLARPTPS